MKDINIVLFFGYFAILLGRVDNFRILNEGNTQKVLLRKLQNFQENEPKTVTWNEILADVLVMKITRKPTKDYQEPSDNGNILSKCFSEVLWFYKTYFYDKFWRISSSSDPFNNGYPSTTPTIEWYNNRSETTQVSYTPRTDTSLKPDSNDTDFFDPKSEVELIEPQYHGKFEDSPATDKPSATETKIESPRKEASCPEGTHEDEDGNCLDPKTSKFILFIPKQCPKGYKMDKLGFCREIW